MLNISDYIEDLEYPQMLSLALDYGTEIMVSLLLTLPFEPCTDGS